MSVATTQSPVPPKKLKNRIELAKYFAELGFKTGAEIGVSHGIYSEILCQSIPNLKLFGVDPYWAYPGNRHYRDQESHDATYINAKKRLEKYPKFIFMKTTSIEATKYIADGCLDFVFIDGNHRYEHVLEDIKAWDPKVKQGGIVSGHDYYEFRAAGVIRAVDECVKEFGVTLCLTAEDKDAPKDSRQPSWYYAKGGKK